MSRLYRKPEWLAFRARVLDFDGQACVRCGRTESSGVILQAHHKRYYPGRMPWDYSPGDCETLCKGCHAKEHGKIRPDFGWDFLREDDLGDLDGKCEVCSTSIRYVFFIDHPKWEPLAVGTDCCDRMTGTLEASNIRRKEERLERFLQSPKWKPKDAELKIRYQKMDFAIITSGDNHQIQLNGKIGRENFQSIEEAKRHIFRITESGSAAAFLERQRKKN